MNIFRIKLKYGVTVAILLGVATIAVQAQNYNYGALQYMLQKRPANEKFENNRFNQHLFFSGALGVHTLFSDTEAQNQLGMNAGLFVGKWVTPIHGVRLGATVGYLPSGVYHRKIKMAGGSLDYLLNISALTYGYDESRVWELLFLAGIEGGHSRAQIASGAGAAVPTPQGVWYYGGHLGLQGNVRLSPTIDLFVEPRVGWYSDAYAHTDSWRGYKVNGSVWMGLTYTPAAPMGTKIHFDNFDKSAFVNHFFLSLSGGMSTLKVPGIRNTLESFGPQVSAGIGKWFSPSSGLRLSGTVGYSDAPAGSDARRFKHVDLHADYLLNFNNIFWGYDEDRLFTLTGIAGLNLAASKGVETSAKYAPGIGLGLQGSFRVNRSVDFFIEPRLNFYNNRYAGGVGVGNSDQLGEVNIGLTYHSIDRADRPKSHFSRTYFTDNLFMTSGIGAQLFLNKTNLQHIGAWGPQLSVSIGKWFTPNSGLRLVGAGGFFSNYVVPSSVENGRLRHISVSAGVDYLWNITNTMSGYDPGRIFELIGAVGVNAAYTSKSDHKLQPGIGAGIQGLWHINDFFGIFLEPQVRLYGNNFIEGNLGFAQKDVMVALNAGFHYRFKPYSKSDNHATFAKEDKRLFISGAFGVGSLLVANKDLVKNMGVELKGSLGKWYTPLSAWRVTGTIMYKGKTPDKRPLHYAGLGFDYMMSLATLAKGYDPHHVIDVVPFVGVTGGLVRRRGVFKPIPGIDAGAQFKLRVSSDFALFVEPKVGIRTDVYDGLEQGRPDRVASCVAGLVYRFKIPEIQ